MQGEPELLWIAAGVLALLCAICLAGMAFAIRTVARTSEHATRCCAEVVSELRLLHIAAADPSGAGRIQSQAASQSSKALAIVRELEEARAAKRAAVERLNAPKSGKLTRRFIPAD